MSLNAKYLVIFYYDNLLPQITQTLITGFQAYEEAPFTPGQHFINESETTLLGYGQRIWFLSKKKI